MKEHVAVEAAQGGAVGVKDMLFQDVRRLTVNGVGGALAENKRAISSLYLNREESERVAAALLPEDRIIVSRTAIEAEIARYEQEAKTSDAHDANVARGRVYAYQDILDGIKGDGS